MMRTKLCGHPKNVCPNDDPLVLTQAIGAIQELSTREAQLVELIGTLTLLRLQPVNIDFQLDGVFECRLCCGEVEFEFDGLVLKKIREEHAEDCSYCKWRAILKELER